ncbi:hypothetical protein [Bacteroidetes bacterium endosymbiont of Geopemphigus sp.]|nr:hypothetical protein [Bacteroidetes bacterium endosymbiont of Geopemphigus sp.]
MKPFHSAKPMKLATVIGDLTVIKGNKDSAFIRLEIGIHAIIDLIV